MGSAESIVSRKSSVLYLDTCPIVRLPESELIGATVNGACALIEYSVDVCAKLPAAPRRRPQM
jgi:hypothetical protein